MSKADKSKSTESRLAPAEKSANAAREKNIDLALSSITKQFGEGSTIRQVDLERQEYQNFLCRDKR